MYLVPIVQYTIYKLPTYKHSKYKLQSVYNTVVVVFLADTTTSRVTWCTRRS